MNEKNKIKEATIEASAKELKDLKASNALGKNDIVKITDNKPTTSTMSSLSSLSEDEAPKENTQPIIKFLSNLKDQKTGQIVKPFKMNGKNYQVIRGVLPTKEVVQAVYCHDDLNEDGSNVIHSLKHFEENIAKPITEKAKKGPDKNGKDYIKHINLNDLKNFKHFIVNTKTGEVLAKYKSVNDMVKSDKRIGKDEEYMTAKELKSYRISNSLTTSKELNEDDIDGEEPNKLEADVTKLIDLIISKFSTSLAKINNPKEQSQFITRIAQEIGVPLSNLQSIVNQGINESKESTKTIESTERKIIRTIKVKDIK